VEYCAASDAYTKCPEGFREFFNQRRRWIPSTLANIVDLLANYKKTVQANDSISRLYIFYQVKEVIFMFLNGEFTTNADLLILNNYVKPILNSS
jgi:cellulose synthase/poly-beta-1,6-N-acetylglucosamine synthase-like glycosyltransferase